MTLGRSRSIALSGISGHLVDVEADIGSGLPAMILIGLPDTSLGESKDRVRSALVNAGVGMPPTRVTVNLSPANLPKQGSGFDLAIAMAIVSGAGVVNSTATSDIVFLGELALDGRLRPISGVLPAVIAAKELGQTTVVVPAGNRAEAELVDGITVVTAASLAEVIARYGGRIDVMPVEALSLSALTETAPPLRDLSDVVGQPEIVDALIVAAAGRHHISMMGPPGAGKTMLAERLVDILPNLSPAESLEVTSIASLVRSTGTTGLETRPPFVAPHHTATTASIIGGGGAVIRPGAISQANAGVLFLDEAPEFSSAVLESLRQPLESGIITIHRAAGTARFPARVHLVLAANPCPCGKFGTPSSDCVCTPDRRRRYLTRISGPILDRIDIRLNVHRVSRTTLTEPSHESITTVTARAKVAMARDTATERWGHVAPIATELRRGRFRLPGQTTASLDAALDRGVLSMRGYDRVIRIAWTLADLDGVTSPLQDHIGRALFMRQGVTT